MQFEQFFEKIAKDQSILQKILHFTIDHPKIVAGGLAGSAALAYLLPKMYAARAQKEQQATLNNIAANNYRMVQLMTPAAQPKKDTFIYV